MHQIKMTHSFIIEVIITATTVSYQCIVKKEMHLRQIFEIKIVLFFYVSKSPQSENKFIAICACMRVKEILLLALLKNKFKVQIRYYDTTSYASAT